MPRAMRIDELLDAATTVASVDAARFADWLLTRVGAPAVDTLGERDQQLATLRAATFGERLDLAAACPGCAMPLDVTLPVSALPPASAPGEARVDVGGVACRVRPVAADDLAAIADELDADHARLLLAVRCLEPVNAAASLPPPTNVELVAIGDTLAALDPAADAYVALRCPGCGTGWDAPLDLPALLAADVGAAAIGLIDEVHDLASSYHWTEPTILALPAARRQAYLARVRA